MEHPLVSANWLQDNLKNTRVLDASYHLPDVKRDANAEFEAAHIPGAMRFDIDAIADRHSPLPHMLPHPDDFTAAMQALGLNAGDHVVFYDDSDVKSAARGWWMMHLFGHTNASVLDGGLAAWRTIDGAMEKAAGNAASPLERGNFTASPAKGMGVTDFTALLGAVRSNNSGQVLDARGAARFAGSAPEPRAGLRAGHIPGSRNLPFNKLFREDGMFHDPETLKSLFAEAGIDVAKPVTATCGSGVTACVLAMGLRLVGNKDTVVYDGSWTEWGASDAPIAAGDADS